MARYRAKGLLFIGTRLIQPGEVFESDEEPGSAWQPLDKPSKDAAEPQRPAKAPKAKSRGKRSAGIHATPLADIPDGWRNMPAIKVINLARRLGMTGGKLPDAIAKIEAEVAARALSSRATEPDDAETGENVVEDGETVNEGEGDNHG